MTARDFEVSTIASCIDCDSGDFDAGITQESGEEASVAQISDVFRTIQIHFVKIVLS